MTEQKHSSQNSFADDDINLLKALLMIVRRRSLIFRVCGASFIISVCYSLALPNVYTATSKFFPPQKETTSSAFSALFAQAGGLTGLADRGLGGSTDLYLGILKSRSVTDAVIKRLDLLKEFNTDNIDLARKILESSIKYKGSNKDGIIIVSATRKDPKKAAELANTIVDETIHRSVQLYLTKAGVERIFLERRLEVVKKELVAAEADLRVFQDKHKTIKVDAQASVAIESIARFKAEIVSKEVQLATLRNSMTDESSEVKALQAGISRMKAQLATMTGSGNDNIIPSTGNLPGIGVEYVRKLRELKIQESIFESLTKQYEVAKISEAKDSSTVQVLDEAVPPSMKSGPRRSLIVIISTFCAFILSITIIIIQEYISNIPQEDSDIFRELKQYLFFWKRTS
jgi:uncharacterized protein involved in exopolysaccharide biosynthesis